MNLNKNINKEALRKAIFHNTGWNFMCPPENIEEIIRYCENGDFNLLSPSTLFQLSGIYRDIALSYYFLTDGGYLPNIFAEWGEK